MLGRLCHAVEASAAIALIAMIVTRASPKCVARIYLGTFQNTHVCTLLCPGASPAQNAAAMHTIVRACVHTYCSNMSIMRRFFEFARANGTLPDIVSWHSWSSNGAALLAEVATMRRYLAAERIPYAGLAVNEMIYWDEWGQPGADIHTCRHADRSPHTFGLSDPSFL